MISRIPFNTNNYQTSIQPIDKTLPGTIAQGQSGAKGNSSNGVLYAAQISRAGALPLNAV